MTLAFINALAVIGALAILATTAIAGFVQLRHMRAGNELAAVLAIENDFRASDVQSALRYVQEQLPARIEEPAYRALLGAPGYIDPRSHPEMIVCNWFNRTGFEYLAYRAATRAQRRTRRSRPSAQRLTIADPWLEEDARRV